MATAVTAEPKELTAAAVQKRVNDEMEAGAGLAPINSLLSCLRPTQAERMPTILTPSPQCGRRPVSDRHECPPARRSGSCDRCGYNYQIKIAKSKHSVPVGVRDLKNRLSAYPDLVKSGEEIVVTEHGRPIARLSPLAADHDRMADLVKAGIVSPPRAAGRSLPSERVTLVGRTSLDEDVAVQRG